MTDSRWMGAALALAKRGAGRTAPNPPVGCVIVKEGRVFGRGWTRPGGRPHAEAEALAQAGEAARGATVFTTLEPCAHVSARGPACSNLLIAAGVARVVAALEDPDPRTAGQGLARLAAAGIATACDVRAADAREAAAGFLTRLALGRPRVTLKLALSLDGRVAMPSGESKWITGEAARHHAHLLRARSDVIAVGRGTWESDRPSLDVRLAGLADRSPRVAVLSRASRGIEALLSEPVNDVLVEGGASLASSLIADDLVDRLIVYRAPVLLGGGYGPGDLGLADLASAHGRWRPTENRQLGTDRLEIYQRAR